MWRSRKRSQNKANATPTTRSHVPPKSEAHLLIPDMLECLGTLAGDVGAVTAKRPGSSAQHMASGSVWARSGSRSGTPAVRPRWRRFVMPWASKTLTPRGPRAAALSTKEAIAYAERGRGERKRPASGWGSLTPTELDVVRLVNEGLGNNDIATRLFVSPRTVQSHLTHVYTKLGLTSRVQLAQEAGRHA